MELQLNPEAINKYVAEKIIESTLGEALANTIETEVKKISQSYDNPIKPLVQEWIRRTANEVLTTEYKDQLRASVRLAITDQNVDQIVQKVLSELLNPKRY